MAVVASLGASSAEKAGPVQALVNEVLSGARELDVCTAKKLIKATCRDRSVDLEAELLPLRRLFQSQPAMGPGKQIGGELQAGVQFTEAAKLMMQSFVYNAGKVHQAHGEARTGEVKKLEGLAVESASQLASRERLGELMDLYKDTRVSPHASGKYIPFTHEHDSNHDIEVVYLGAMERFDRQLNSAVARFFRSEAASDSLENDPMKSVREYLEGNYERIR